VPNQPELTRSIEVEATSVDEAIAKALEQLNATRDAVEIEILSKGRRGLFGGQRGARVRVALLAPPAQTDNGTPEEPPAPDAALPERSDETTESQEEPMSDTDTPQQTEAGTEEELTPEQWLELLDHDADLAADFIEGLLDLLDLPGDIEIVTEEQQAFVTVQDVGSGLLIGRRGATLDALQELVRCAIQRQTERRSHVRVDVEGYRARQLEKLRDKCRDAIAEVRESGEPVRLEPMDAYERKMMHDLVAKTGKVTSSSEGNEPRRRVVIHPAED
jgi:spoIIIJ-associated protein